MLGDNIQYMNNIVVTLFDVMTYTLNIIQSGNKVISLKYTAFITSLNPLQFNFTKNRNQNLSKKINSVRRDS